MADKYNQYIKLTNSEIKEVKKLADFSEELKTGIKAPQPQSNLFVQKIQMTDLNR